MSVVPWTFGVQAAFRIFFSRINLAKVFCECLQVIEVPKILREDVPMRAVLRAAQLAEQLVEVPTIVSYSWLQLRMEQTVGILVPGRGGRISGLQGFLP